MPKKLTQKQKLEQLRQKFKYNSKGKVDINSYGEFKHGVTDSEVEDYLRVRSGKMAIKTIEKKFNDIAGRNTAMLVTVEGSIFTVGDSEKTTVCVILNYRHDIERFADVLFEGKPTYFD